MLTILKPSFAFKNINFCFRFKETSFTYKTIILVENSTAQY
ncbi:hypothetical protein HJ01_00164 [Flavobacterium frigoris PS1]|uniref:Uncharacterized protein n=1 Tax=Flavobacterium frigoris (strain PS1) TaxID=1086011 RepID=H7FLW6_FLAFP|nr:hypothetical protein HJ01_00164 [Flavobacterium frigoris PS1]